MRIYHNMMGFLGQFSLKQCILSVIHVNDKLILSDKYLCTGEYLLYIIMCKHRFLMSGTLIYGYKTNKNSSTHSKLGTC